MKRLIIFILLLIVLVAWFIFSTVKPEKATQPPTTEQISRDQVSNYDRSIRDYTTLYENVM